MAHKVFEKPIRVHFSNCDPAGIVFHPQYFVLINELMEDFLEDVAGVGFIEITEIAEQTRIFVICRNG